jgi:hypothetical protein
MEDTRNRLHDIHYFEVKHIYRDANQVAHMLAKAALRHLLDNCWIQECPSNI